MEFSRGNTVSVPNHQLLCPELEKSIEALSIEKEWANHYPMLLRLARRMAYRICLEPEDILSQATVKVLTYCKNNNEIQSFPSLMRLSIKQVYLDNKRNHRELIFLKSCELDVEKNVDARPDLPSFAEHNMATNETLEQVLAYVRTLPEQDKKLFYLRFLDEHSFTKISELTGMTEVNARKKISKIRIKLKFFITE